MAEGASTVKLIVPAGTSIIPGTIACIGLCDHDAPHRHDLHETYGPPLRMHESPTLSRIVARLARHYGLQVLIIPDSRRAQMRGWPDLTIKGKRLLFRELKSQGGYLTTEQRELGALLTRAGGDWAVWQPIHLYSGHIETKLREIA